MRTISTFLSSSLHIIFVLTAIECVLAQAQAPAPTLLTEENSARAIALDSVTRVRDPVPVVALNNFMQGRDQNEDRTLWHQCGSEPRRERFGSNCHSQGFAVQKFQLKG